MTVGIVVGLLVVCLAALLVTRARRYRRLLADEHFLEVGRALALIKAAALAKIVHTAGDEPQSADDARILTTTAGLAIVYTVSQDATGGHLHHCSVSVVGGPTPHAVGGTFVLFIAKLLDLPIARLRLEIGASTVHHAEVGLDQAEHQRFAAASVSAIEPSAVAELRRDAFESRARLAWHPAPMPPG